MPKKTMWKEVQSHLGTHPAHRERILRFGEIHHGTDGSDAPNGALYAASIGIRICFPRTLRISIYRVREIIVMGIGSSQQ